jgi:hypothetical protein
MIRVFERFKLGGAPMKTAWLCAALGGLALNFVER